MKKLAILGAGDFQNPLILKAEEKGYETHVFAWRSGDIGEKTADHFYPVSTAEKDKILDICREIGIDGICAIGSDFNNITATYIANELGLTANSVETVERSTNKHLMRETFAQHGDSSPKSILVTPENRESVDISEMRFPLIVKPTDRSGSRGITRLEKQADLQSALDDAFSCSWEHAAVVEEYVTGEEFSVEYISWKGEHHFLQMTKKFTTGAPHFIETGHFEPALISNELVERTKAVVSHALDSLGVQYGASHSEVIIDRSGKPWIVEIGSRMGGDCIGSDLVELSTGIDFVGGVADVALGLKPDLTPQHSKGFSMIRFIFSQEDLDALVQVQKDCPELLCNVSKIEPFDHAVTDSSNRFGFFVMRGQSLSQLWKYLPIR
ncbi:acetyl-CoA carboxylase biotin carboxylase subunit family protein [Olsenella sp. Marseille-P4559]|uniref:ATP-grasp domain-containing protein n=1 Tax=Olsenella sp. Marseille-P4559 TaxID=2364795 RepID=UPI00103114E1|nr:ATP-grasp domain-containing protein [Olsenella sp. Marseille-P4559]